MLKKTTWNNIMGFISYSLFARNISGGYKIEWFVDLLTDL